MEEWKKTEFTSMGNKRMKIAHDFLDESQGLSVDNTHSWFDPDPSTQFGAN